MGTACGWGKGRAWPTGSFFWFESGWPAGSRRERWVRALEEYQRDLEQAAADMADLIRRFQDDLGQDETNV